MNQTLINICPQCQQQNPAAARSCSRCGYLFSNYGTAPMATPSDVSGKKIAAGVCGILLGALGIHKFLLGYTQAGVIMLLVTLLTCGFAGAIMHIIGIIEGIIYLTKSDEQFYREYVANNKEWF